MKNKFGVKKGQLWKDNDERTGKRQFEILSVDLNYYPGGRAECKLLGDLKKGQRPVFFARLDRFNGTLRGYSLVVPGKTAKKKAKKKARKAGSKK